MIDESEFPKFDIELKFTGSPWQDYETNKYSQYGLYEPITNRIIFVGHQYTPMRTLTKLFSSRYTLSLVDITTAKNWNENLIDNYCCTDWGLLNFNALKSNLELYHNGLPYYADTLFYYGPLDKSELILKDEDYLHFAYNVITWIRDIYFFIIQDASANTTVTDIDLFYHENLDFFNKFECQDFSTVDHIFRQSKRIYNIIYTEFNYQTAVEKINIIIENIKNG